MVIIKNSYVQSKSWLNAAVTYGYFPCYSENNDLVILHHEGENAGKERVRFSFPRQSRDRRLCLADFFNRNGQRVLQPFDPVYKNFNILPNVLSF